MGQYHTVYNVTKKQKIEPHPLDNGAKLLEQMGWSGGVANLLFALLANSNGRGGGDINTDKEGAIEMIGSWAGDEIVIQGDYVEEDDTAYISNEELEKYEDISGKLLSLQKVIQQKFN